jgi:hypothetical protein
MSAFASVLASAFLVSLATDVIASITYIAMSNSRDSRGGLPRSPEHQLRFESIWAMVLALPALLRVAAVCAFPDSREAWHLLLGIAVLGLYVNPTLAPMGRSLPKAARWYPAVIAIGALPVLVVLGVMFGYGAVWLIFFVPISSRLGFGYAADCMVGVRFARAVARRDLEDARDRELVQLADAPGFVWPR